MADYLRSILVATMLTFTCPSVSAESFLMPKDIDPSFFNEALQIKKEKEAALNKDKSYINEAKQARKDQRNALQQSRPDIFAERPEDDFIAMTVLVSSTVIGSLKQWMDEGYKFQEKFKIPVHVEFKGFPEGINNTSEFNYWLWPYIKDVYKKMLEKSQNGGGADAFAVNLNPIPFEQFGVKQAPCVGVKKGVKKVEYLVCGGINMSYVLEQYKKGARGIEYFEGGFDVVEKDLILEMKDRLKEKNIDEKGKGALKRYLSKNQSNLSKAETSGTRLVRKMIEIKRDFEAPSGKTFPAGALVPATDVMPPIENYYIVFDATDEAEKRFAKAIYVDFRKNKPDIPVYLLTPRLNGQEHYKNLAKYFDVDPIQIKYATQEFVDLVGIERTVSTFRIDFDRQGFAINEYSATDVKKYVEKNSK